MHRHIDLIVNPYSGNGKAATVMTQVQTSFDEAGIALDVHHTAYPRHAIEIARQIDLDRSDGIVVVGGDGTFHELLNGLLSRTSGDLPPVGTIPAGTGNAFLDDFGIRTPAEIMGRIIDNQTRKVDVGKAQMGDESLYFVNILGYGIVVDIGRLGEKLKWLGGNAYTIATLVKLTHLQPRAGRIILDGKEHHGEHHFVLVCNTIHTGRGMKMAPAAKTDDGLFDVVMLHAVGAWKLLKTFPKIFHGGHITADFVELHQASEIQLIPDHPEPLNIDGELYQHAPVSIEMLPGHIEVFV